MNQLTTKQDITAWLVNKRERYAELRRIHRIENELANDQAEDKLLNDLRILAGSKLLKGNV